MPSLLATIRSIKPQIVAAYLVLAAVILVLVIGAVLGTQAAVRANTIPIVDTRSGHMTVEVGGARSVEAEIAPDLGELYLHGGAADLLELAYVTNLPDDPKIAYTVDRREGDLTIEPSIPRGIPDIRHFSEYRNEWDLRLNSEIPIDLELILGAGNGELDLRGMTLQSLAVEIGAGEALVDLRGDWAQGFDATIAGGAGKVTVLLPDDVGVRLAVERAIGAINLSGLERRDERYVNSAYDTADVALEFDVEVGIGEVNIIVLDEDEVWTEDEDGEASQ